MMVKWQLSFHNLNCTELAGFWEIVTATHIDDHAPRFLASLIKILAWTWISSCVKINESIHEFQQFNSSKLRPARLEWWPYFFTFNILIIIEFYPFLNILKPILRWYLYKPWASSQKLFWKIIQKKTLISLNAKESVEERVLRLHLSSQEPDAFPFWKCELHPSCPFL